MEPPLSFCLCRRRRPRGGVGGGVAAAAAAGTGREDSRVAGVAIGRHPPAGDARQDLGSVAGAPDAAADKPSAMVGYPIVSFRVLTCSSWTRAFGRRPFVHLCLGRNVYLVRTSSREVSLSLAEFRSKSPSCVRLGRESGALRVATLSDVGDAAAADYDRLSNRLLFVRGEEQSTAPGGGSLSEIELVLVAPSEEVCRAWAMAGGSLVLPWPVLLSLDRADEASPVAAVRSLVGSTNLFHMGTTKRGVVSAALGVRGRRAVVQAAHWLQPLMNSESCGGGGGGALAAVLDSVDQISGVPVAGPVLRVALLVVQSTALAVLADAHHAMRVSVLERSADFAGRLVTLVDEAIAREPTAFATAHVAQLCGVLSRVEVMLDAVEATFFADPTRTMLTDRVVRGWIEQLEVLGKELADMCALGAVGYGVDWMAARVATMERLSLRDEEDEPDMYDLRWRPPALDAGYVCGVDNPQRAEHAIIVALLAPSRGDADKAPRVGICAVGGSGKTTACAGVAACNWVHARFTKGTAWVQLDASSTLQSVAEAVVALVHRFCGGKAAKQLAALTADKHFVAVAAGYVRSVPVVDAAEWLVVIDDVLYKKRALLRQLLALIPPATSVIFSTRSEAVLASVPGATLVSIDALPVEDARLVLAAAAGRAATPGVSPFSAAEETGWVRRVLSKTECHALSLTIVGSMIADRGGAWRAVVEGLERWWMHPFFGCSDSDSPRPSVRAALDVSLELLPDVACRDACAALGVLPVHVHLPVLARLWGSPLGGAATTDEPSVRQSNDLRQSAGVEQLVASLVRAGFLRRNVDEASGELIGVIVHPVVGQYALTLLGDATRAVHQRMINAYMVGIAVDGLDAHGWQRLPFWEMTNDGYWYDHVVRHIAAAGDLCGLVSVMDPAWQAVRVRVSSPLAFQADVEQVLNALTVIVDDTASGSVRSPVLLGRVHAALASVYHARIAGSRRTNLDAAITHWDKALALVDRLKVPALWAEWQAGLGRVYCKRVNGSRAANLEEAIACSHRALEVRTRTSAPLEWAETQKLLGTALVNRVRDGKAANVEAAIACYDRSLEVQTQEATPLEWADTQNSLGVAYYYRVNGDAAANMEAAIACYNRALEKYTRSVAPLLWARTCYNLGLAYYDRLVGDKAASIETAIACYNDALTVHTRDATPLMWAATQSHLGKALRDRLVGDTSANVAAAAACFDRALTLRTQAAVPLNWAATQHHMGVMHHGRHKAGATGAAGVDAAVACFYRALEARTPEAAPQDWALTTFSLMQALLDGKRWSAVVDRGRALERFGPRWASWTAQKAAVACAVAEAEHALAQLSGQGRGT